MRRAPALCRSRRVDYGARMVLPSQRPARRLRREAGVLHGLSLVLFTAVLLGGLAFFASKELPVRCACADKSIVTGTRGGLQSAQSRCDELCAEHGGGEPAAPSPPSDPGPKRPRRLRQ